MRKIGSLILLVSVFLFFSILLENQLVQASHFNSANCPSPYHVITYDDRCVWSCGTGTQPNTTSNQCSCKPGYTQTGTDSFGRRICSSLTSSPTPSPTTTATTNMLTVSISTSGGLSGGRVTGSGISCPGTCYSKYSSTTSVALTATANSGFVFTGWSGACSGTSSTCTVLMSSAKSVTALFAPISSPSPSTSPTPSPTRSASPSPSPTPSPTQQTSTMVSIGLPKKTLSIGQIWYVGGGYSIAVQSIDARTSPRQAWITFNRDGTKLDDKIITQGEVYTYGSIFTSKADSIFAGATSDLLQLTNTAISSSVIGTTTTPTMVAIQSNTTAGKKTLTVGQTWNISGGYSIAVQSIDARTSPRQAWIVLSKDGVKKDDKIINQGQTYTYIERSYGGQADVEIFRTYSDSIFAGATTDMLQLRNTFIYKDFDVYTPSISVPSSTPTTTSRPCSDSDNGYYPYEFGSVSWIDRQGVNKITDDVCIGSNLMEAICDANGYANNAQTFQCPNGCSNGVCIGEATPTTTPIQTPSASCQSDSDCAWKITNNCPETAGASWSCMLGSRPIRRYSSTSCPDILSPEPQANCGCVQGTCAVFEKEKPREPPKKIDGTEIDTADLLSLVIQLEQLKARFEFLQAAVIKLAGYYSTVNKVSDVDKWQKTSQILQSGIEKIESVKDTIRDKLADFKKEDLRKVKKDIKSVTNLIKDLIKALLQKSSATIIPTLTASPEPANLTSPSPIDQPQVQDGPDLRINSCIVSPSNPKESDRTQIILQVQNAGNRDANFPGGAWDLKAENTGGGYSPICYDVPAGQTVNCSISWQPFEWSAGVHNPRFIIDPDNRVGESDEGNNNFTCPVTITRETNFADLVITNVELTEARPTLQNNFKVRVTVTNLGSVNATIQYPNLVVSSTYIEYVYPPYNSRWTLASGESATFEKNPNAGYLREGTQNWSFTIDPGSQVTESNETNNAYTKEVTIYPAGAVSGPAPDLKINSCSISPPNPKDSDRTTITLRVQNIGSANAVFPGGSWPLRVRNAGGGYSPDCRSVPAGQTVNCSVSWSPFDWPAGTHNPVMIIDSDNRIGESNETNNEFTCPITLAQETNFADLVITNVELTEARPTLQNDFKIRVTVQNQGTVNATIRYPNLVVSSTYMEYVYPPYNGQWTLAPSASATFEKNPNAGYLREGTQSWIFTVDPGTQVRESNETNNAFNKTVTIYPT